MNEQLVQAPVQRVVGDHAHGTVQQIAHGAALVPVPVQPPLAARVDQLVAHLCLQHIQPARALPARRQPRPPEPIQFQSVPERKRQPARPPLPRPMQAQRAHVDPHDFAVQLRRFPVVGKQRHRRRPGIPLEHLDRAAPGGALAVVDLAQIEELALHHAAVAVAAVLHHAPIAVLLAVLESSLGAHKHGRIACPNGPSNQGARSALQAIRRGSDQEKQCLR